MLVQTTFRTNKENSRESEWKRESHKDGDAFGCSPDLASRRWRHRRQWSMPPRRPL